MMKYKRYFNFLLTFLFAFGCFYASAQNPVNIVWPGDVNNNGVVNHYDLLYLGAIYGEQGISRDEVSISWEGKELPGSWSVYGDSLYLNAGFGDCNGDGTVDHLDLDVIDINYALEHDNFYKDSFEVNNQGQIMISFEGDNVIEVQEGEVIEMDINLGDDLNIVDSFYGLAFNLKVNTEVIDLSSFEFELNNEWIISDSLDLISIQKVNYSDTTFNVALSKTNLEMSSGGSGRIGTIRYVIEYNVPSFTANTELLSFQDVVVVDNNLWSLYEIEKEILFVESTSPIKELPEYIYSIHPNPVDKGVLTILGLDRYSNVKIQLFDIAGRLMDVSLTDYNNIKVNHLPNGIYFVHLTNAKGRWVEKILVDNK